MVGFGFHCGGTRKVKSRCEKMIWLIIRFAKTESFEEHRGTLPRLLDVNRVGLWFRYIDVVVKVVSQSRLSVAF